MVQNYDLKTAQKAVSATTPGENIITDAVPTGMKRYITYLKYTNTNVASQNITIADTPTTGDVTAGTVLDKQTLSPGDTIMFPDTPDPDRPIMRVDSAHYLAGMVSAGADMDVTVGYYDQ